MSKRVVIIGDSFGLGEYVRGDSPPKEWLEKEEVWYAEECEEELLRVCNTLRDKKNPPYDLLSEVPEHILESAKSKVTYPPKEKSNLYSIGNGIEELLIQDGFIVDNLSRGATPNLTNYRKLKKYLTTETPDYIIWYLTDPFRDYNFIQNSKVRGYQELIDIQTNSVKTACEKFNSLGHQILVIGAHSIKVDRELVKEFENLTIVAESAMETAVADKDFNASEVSFASGWLLKLQIYKNFKEEDLDKLLEQKKIWDSYAELDVISADRSTHLNLEGQTRLYQKVKEYL